MSKGDPIIFQKLGTSLKLGPAQSLSGSAIDDLPTCLNFFFNKNRCSHKTKVKTERQVTMSNVSKMPPSLTFLNGSTSMTTRLGLRSIIR